MDAKPRRVKPTHFAAVGQRGGYGLAATLCGRYVSIAQVTSDPVTLDRAANPCIYCQTRRRALEGVI